MSNLSSTLAAVTKSGVANIFISAVWGRSPLASLTETVAKSWLGRHARIPVVLMVGVLLATCAAAGSKVAPDMPNVSPNTPVDIIVRFRTLPTKDELKTFGAYGQMKKIFNSIKAIHTQVPLSVVTKIEADPNVVYISPNRPLKGKLEFAEPTVNANIALQYGFDGSGVGVAIV